LRGATDEAAEIMPFQFTHPWWLPVLAVAIAWVIRLALRSDASLAGPRRAWVLGVRLGITLALGLALSGLQYRMPVDGMNVFFLLDRSDSVPAGQQEVARELVNTLSERKRAEDQGGVVVFGAEAAIESTVGPAVNLQRVHAVFSTVGHRSGRGGAVWRPRRFRRPASGGSWCSRMATRPWATPCRRPPRARSLGGDRRCGAPGCATGPGRGRSRRWWCQGKLKQGQTFDVKMFRAERPRAPAGESFAVSE
jgi:hypothetical protein